MSPVAKSYRNRPRPSRGPPTNPALLRAYPWVPWNLRGTSVEPPWAGVKTLKNLVNISYWVPWNLRGTSVGFRGTPSPDRKWGQLGQSQLPLSPPTNFSVSPTWKWRQKAVEITFLWFSKEILNFYEKLNNSMPNCFFMKVQGLWQKWQVPFMLIKYLKPPQR